MAVHLLNAPRLFTGIHGARNRMLIIFWIHESTQMEDARLRLILGIQKKPIYQAED